MQTWNAPQLILAAIIAICWRGIDEFAIFAPLTTGAIRYDIPTRLAVTATGHYPVVAASPWRVAGGDCHCDPATRPSGDGGKRSSRPDRSSGERCSACVNRQPRSSAATDARKNRDAAARQSLQQLAVGY
ncbi:Hypothetical protein c5451 [Escherichia coli CFT073]|uniref:Uncharacterized protein n=1 Tax=Escherichia coli O6:H1 (strain CFT073 / ATCC 700928 / UPEC) TaxID=199310 RepID=A0A0H2VEA6_ECOL6|nr:Hypothetical protein c5451 [Escherichia coli CFT073]